MTNIPQNLISDIRQRANDSVKSRLLVGIAGPPASGKSTLADNLVTALDHELKAAVSVVLPMDGYHLDNVLLDDMGARDRKGAPHTFDIDGFASILQRVSRGGDDVVVPVFDRTQDLARAGGRKILATHRIVIVEGNYLLLDQPAWSDLHLLFDYTIYLSVDEPELHRRLVQRWLDHGLNNMDAVARAEANDLPNARLVALHRLPADTTVRENQYREDKQS